MPLIVTKCTGIVPLAIWVGRDDGSIDSSNSIDGARGTRNRDCCFAVVFVGVGASTTVTATATTRLVGVLDEVFWYVLYAVSKMISKIKQRNEQNSVSDFSLFFAT